MNGLRELVSNWLEENLPALVERSVLTEVASLARSTALAALRDDEQLRAKVCLAARAQVGTIVLNSLSGVHETEAYNDASRLIITALRHGDTQRALRNDVASLRASAYRMRAAGLSIDEVAQALKTTHKRAERLIQAAEQRRALLRKELALYDAAMRETP